MPYLHSFGHHLPDRIVTNDELAQACGVDPAWILEVSGIRERRYAAEADTVASLGQRAAEACLANAGLNATDLGMILCSSGSPDRFCPGPAATIAAGLGLTGTPALDIPTASAGSLTALVLADRLAPSLGPVLVLGSEIMSRRVERTPAGKNTAILFGDGAGAALIVPDDHATPGVPSAPGFARIAGHALYTDGTASEILTIADGLLHMEGTTVILQAARKLPRAITDLLVKHSLAPGDIGHVLMHQANLNLITKVARATAIDPTRFFINIDRYGNTSSASMLIAASEWHAQLTPGPLTAPVLFTAFGAGLNWGALLALAA